ncbi:MAG: RNase H family protein [Pirellulaceae bacterium]
MPNASPHYLLFSEGSAEGAGQEGGRGRWKFVLESVDGQGQLEAEDEEESTCGERLELLALVRGLEALPQPSRVTLVTSSRYVARGLRFGLTDWRENDWQWEHFGQMMPVKNADLWQRVDRATRIHQVQCRTLRFDAPQSSQYRVAPPHAAIHSTAKPPHAAAGIRPARRVRRPDRAAASHSGTSLVSRCVHSAARRMREWLRRAPAHAAQLL